MRKTKNLKYKLILGITFGLFLTFEILKPKPTDWKITLDPDDKIPFGAYAFKEFLPDLFTQGNLFITDESVYQTFKKDSAQNIIITSKIFEPGTEDLVELKKALESGQNCLLIAEDVSKEMKDTFDIDFNYQFFVKEQVLLRKDTIQLNIGDKSYPFPEAFISSSISPFKDDYNIISRTSEGKIIFIEKEVGDGKLLICTIPLLTTNFTLLSGENVEMMEFLINKLPDEKTTWTSLYISGKNEPKTILRYILVEPSLRWAYAIGIISLFLFMIFRLKREQRQIPTIKPPRNSSIEFAATVGQLYLKHGNHKDIALKRLTYLKDHMLRHYFLHVNFTEDEIEKVVQKTGKDESVVNDLYKVISDVKAAENIRENQLVYFNQKLEEFYLN